MVTDDPKLDPDVKRDWVVYLLVCYDATLYCGVTNDLERRVKVHNAGRVKYTRSRRPVSVFATRRPFTKGEALSVEYEMKRQDRSMKRKILETFDWHEWIKGRSNEELR